VSKILFKKNAANKIKKRFVEIGDLPSELITNCSRMVLYGNREFKIENYDGIIEYEVNKIRVSTASGIISIIGDNLTLSELNNDELLVSGLIKNIDLEGNE
jgi:sporulation protein YqfC